MQLSAQRSVHFVVILYKPALFPVCFCGFKQKNFKKKKTGQKEQTFCLFIMYFVLLMILLY